MTKCRQAINEISSITVGEVVIEDPRHVKAKVLEHFTNQYSEHWASRPQLGGPFKSVEGTMEYDFLEKEFTEVEIKEWRLLKGINSSFITLIPKKDNPIGLSDYRPISLVESIYKIIAKLLANRLKVVLPHIISETQLAFINGRSILDGVLIANEVVDGWKLTEKKRVVLKLDFENPYDFINWGYLFFMLSKFGFGSKWSSWIKECVSIARISVPVNGSPTEEFSPQRGLRQGDPFSLFLFNIVIEGLHILLTRAQDLGLINGVKVGLNGVVLSHLHFTDDSLLFCEAKEAEVRNLKRVLRCFEIMSELKRKIHMIKWDELSKRVDQGALGIRKVKEVNNCLLIKWWWRFGYEDEALWKRVICSKYKLEVGDGRRINLWTDIWCQAASFKDMFPSLYRLSMEKSVSLRIIYDRKALSGEWNLAFRRKLYDWKEGAIPSSVDHLLVWWAGQMMKKMERKIWSAIPLVVLWSIWKHRNECVFRAAIPNLSELFEWNISDWNILVENGFDILLMVAVFDAANGCCCSASLGIGLMLDAVVLLLL
ncbi:uncharacterized protein LOC114298468 [Camellia sinensis]|uniref:uncharacterized protein LOC114298468 n=1 Tax=Camellia sinensis TaxID=4442 RepID=UPI001036DCB4|nr:uncharacterized protein LOC114298468 [Camellia sinensis]